jgi:NTP pyrophosphatase (non-canonical NTP hydrolase)
MSDLRNLSKEELEEQLTKLRSSRKSGYSTHKKSKKRSEATITIPSLVGLSDEVAEKVLAELLENMAKKEAEDAVT